MTANERTVLTMDRLTRRSEVSGIMLVRGHGLGPAYFDSKRDYKIYCEAIDRLAAYEDTGLEPEEIAEYIDATDEYVRASEDGRLIVLPCKKESDYAGLKIKYVVVKAGTGELVENCFVLRPDKDPAARHALEAYAQATDNQVLASDITDWIGDSGKVIVLPCKVGDTVWQVHPSYRGARQVTYHSVSGIVEDLEKGWGIGNTIEEAEAALGGDAT